MKLVYTHPNIAVVTQAQSLIEQAGIESVIRNEYASGASGELAPISAWPEVWVVNDGDHDRAVSLLEALKEESGEPDWRCRQCDNANPATFESCWRCGLERPQRD